MGWPGAEGHPGSVPSGQRLLGCFLLFVILVGKTSFQQPAKIRVGLYGINGHQIHQALAHSRLGKLIAIAAIPRKQLPPALRDDPSVRVHEGFEELLADPDVDFISLCSPRRANQADEAQRALRAGKHVLAEKPCALTEKDLDAIMNTACETGKSFHEMAGTAFEHPYFAMREVVRSGRLGEIVQVIAEKSYPYFETRAQDEALDGGLIAQNGIHALRFVEHVAGCRIASILATETKLGNPIAEGGLRMAASMLLTLANGGVSSISVNYLNPRGTGVWGYETLKILGTRGIVESRAGGQYTRLVIGEKDLGPLDTAQAAPDWLETFFASILGDVEMPLSLEEEFSPTRWAIRANLRAKG
ncbi:MAG: Gfo/Idh/MocA family protein [Chthoniobacteraceae bacterium]